MLYYSFSITLRSIFSKIKIPVLSYILFSETQLVLGINKFIIRFHKLNNQLKKGYEANDEDLVCICRFITIVHLQVSIHETQLGPKDKFILLYADKLLADLIVTLISSKHAHALLMLTEDFITKILILGGTDDKKATIEASNNIFNRFLAIKFPEWDSKNFDTTLTMSQPEDAFKNGATDQGQLIEVT